MVYSNHWINLHLFPGNAVRRFIHFNTENTEKKEFPEND